MNTRHRRLLAAVVAVSAAVSSAGCATHNTLRYGAPGTPKIYSGTRLNLAVLREDAQALDALAAYGVFPPDYPWPLMPVIHATDKEQSVMDFAASAVADTVLLPVTIPYAAYHRVIHPPE